MEDISEIVKIINKTGRKVAGTAREMARRTEKILAMGNRVLSSQIRLGGLRRLISRKEEIQRVEAQEKMVKAAKMEGTQKMVRKPIRAVFSASEISESTAVDTLDYTFREELMEEDTDRIRNLRSCRCPYLSVDIQGISVNALSDTGSEITIISEQFYEDNKKY